MPRHPHIFAYGVRNPWKMTFAPDGRLWVADVGQNRMEEISVATAGANLGWNVMEGSLCFNPPRQCRREGLTLPVHTYEHDQGRSITGGVVHSGRGLPELRDHFVFGDFVTGRLWALPFLNL